MTDEYETPTDDDLDELLDAALAAVIEAERDALNRYYLSLAASGQTGPANSELCPW